MTVIDDVPRIEATARLSGLFVQMLDGVMRGPRGKLLRRAVGDDGRHLFSTADTEAGVVWWPAGTLVEVLRALRAAVHARECGERCEGKSCRRCRGSGYVSPTLKLAPTPPTLPVEGDVAELWGWVKGMEGRP